MSKYNEAMEKISADEDLKDETKNMLMQRDEVKPLSRRTAPRKFAFSQRFFAAAVAAALICTLLVGGILSSVLSTVDSYTTTKSGIINEIKSRKDGSKNAGTSGGGLEESLES